jgi:glycosyltransferase involved in cell wall biosynthesis
MHAGNAITSADPYQATLDSKVAWPRIALVTPVLNSVKYIEQTIRSVLAQEYPSLDYFIVDGGSTDGTLDVIRKYEKRISGWISEPDKGMYDAINKGFARTSGEIMGWINATDMLQLGGLSVVASVFRDLPDVEWITGRPTIFNEQGMTVQILALTRWSRYRFLAGANQTIQQESTYWRRALWDRAGGSMDTLYPAAGDFELWVRFFRYARVYSVDAPIGGWRSHADALGQGNLDHYVQHCDEIVEKELNRLGPGRWLKLLRRIGRTLKPIPIIRGVWRLLVTNSLYYRPGPDWPPIIEYQWDKWGFRRK